ncbi:alcohol dehydrogenase catalytic domain-containing protein [soil metagenome]
MRQAVIAAPGRIEVRHASVPDPGPGEVRVRSTSVGICGSDLHALQGKHPFITLPVVPGHEVAGVVDAVGEGAGEWRAGDRVFLEPNLVCGRCSYCTSGRYNLCIDLRVVGCQTAGALADAFVVPASRLHRVPEGMTMTQAALVEPLATCTHALRMAGGVTGRTVAVLGAGTIGLLMLAAAKAQGAETVAVTDLVAAKRDRALALGADVAVDASDAKVVEKVRTAFAGPRPDVVFDCVATQGSITQAIALALKGGTVVVVGVPTSPVEVPLPLIQDREVRIQGTAMYVRDDFTAATELVRTGRVDVAALVTGRFPLRATGEAFNGAASGEHVKVHIELEA